MITPTPMLPHTLRTQINTALQANQFNTLTTDARHTIRHLAGLACTRGHDDGWIAGADDTRIDTAIERRKGDDT